MKKSTLTEEERQNGKRTFLNPLPGTLKLMQPVTREEFGRLVKKAIPPSRPRPLTSK